MPTKRPQLANDEIYHIVMRGVDGRVIFPQEEDFGITAIEAMASGRPVIAFAAGAVERSQNHGRQNTNNSDDHQKFYKRKTFLIFKHIFK